MSVSVVASPQPRWKARNANVLAGFFMRQFLYGLKPPGIPAVSMLGPVVRKGDVVTDFELPDETGAPRRLSGLLADGPVVLFFYTSGASSNWLNAMSTSGRPMLGASVTAAWPYSFPTPHATRAK